MLGTVNETDLCWLGGIPADCLKDVFGITAEEIDTLYPEERQHAQMDGHSHELVDFCEVIHLNGAKPLAIYTDGYYQNTAAAAIHSYGKGTAVYQACRDSGSLKEQIISKLIADAGVTSVLDTEQPLPAGVSAHSRTDGEHTYVFVENYYNHESEPVKLRGKMLDMLSGEITNTCTLGPYGFKVFKTM
jgi:beta-galactosidase